MFLTKVIAKINLLWNNFVFPQFSFEQAQEVEVVLELVELHVLRPRPQSGL